MVLFWFGMSIVLMVVELLSGTFVLAWFSVGAFFAGIMAVLRFDLSWQIIGFSLVSLGLVVTTRLIAAPLWSKKEDKLTNLEAIVGAQAVTLTDVSDTGGLVRLRGEVWSAMSESPIPAGRSVLVQSVEGVKLKVRKV